MHVSAADALKYCNPMPCLAYIGVYGALASSYSLLVTTSDASQEQPIRLHDGIEQQVSLQHAGDYAYFSFRVGDGVKSFEVDVTPTSGDPDLYVGANVTFPTRETWTWRSTGGAGEALTIDTDGGVACVECDYHFSVYAWSPDVSFSIIVTSAAGTRLLRDGVPASTTVRVGQVKYFRYLLRSRTKVQAVVTPFSGNPSLFVRFGVKPFNPHNKSNDASRVVPFASSEASGIEALTIAPDDPSANFCRPPCTMYLAIRNDGDTNSSCSVLVQQRRTGVSTLVDGQPQAGVVSAGELRYYSISVPDMAAGLTIHFASLMGSPKLYMSRDLQLPNSTWQSNYADATKHTIKISQQQTGGGTFVFGVDGQGHPANYSLVARSGRGVQLLQDGREVVPTLSPGEQLFCKIIVPEGAEAPLVLVSPCAAVAFTHLGPPPPATISRHLPPPCSGRDLAAGTRARF